MKEIVIVKWSWAKLFSFENTVANVSLPTYQQCCGSCSCWTYWTNVIQISLKSSKLYKVRIWQKITKACSKKFVFNGSCHKCNAMFGQIWCTFPKKGTSAITGPDQDQAPFMQVMKNLCYSNGTPRTNFTFKIWLATLLDYA